MRLRYRMGSDGPGIRRTYRSNNSRMGQGAQRQQMKPDGGPGHQGGAIHGSGSMASRRGCSRGHQVHGNNGRRDTRQVLKMQTTRRWHQVWRAPRAHQEIHPELQRDRLARHPRHVHDNKRVHTFFSLQHQIKKVHGMLPTIDILNVRRLDLYKDDRYRLCQAGTENNDHIWACPESRDMHTTRYGAQQSK